jgi:hypothetical protein
MLFRYSPLLKPENPTEHHNFNSLLRNGFDSGTYICHNGTRWIYNVTIYFFHFPQKLHCLKIFGDCVDTPLKHAGFAIGLISLLLWLVPMFPQLYTNYKNKRCEGLSIFFIICW